MNTKRFICSALNTALCASTLALFGCNQQTPTSAAPAAPATAPAPAPASTPATAGTAAAAPSTPAYTPPSADQLYQMVAPIALFPDNLVAQVLAGSTYPDQITAADNLLAQNPNLKGNLLQTAVNPQPWDASVKGLTAFPSVLDQMAKNIEWTTSLGTAYVNDPTDVMNAIQVMRQRASQHGSLKSTAQQRVSTQAVAATTTTTTSYESAPPDYPPTYAGPSVVPAPEQVIEIQPAQPDVVYVPAYNPETVYGAPVAYYPGYTYERPAYSTGDVVVAGAIGFGAGILIANLFDHHDNHSWGWHSWGMHWGGGPGPGYGGGGGGWQRPAVVHNNNVYVSNSNTVINRYTTNNIVNNRYVNNGQITNNRFVNNGQINHGPVVTNNRPMPGNLPANAANFHPPGPGGMTPQARAAAAAAPHGPMSMPDFRHAGVPGQQPIAHGAPNAAMQANRPGQVAGHPQAAAFAAQHAAAAPHPGQAPAFNREAIAHPPAVNQHGGAPHPEPFRPAQAAPHQAEPNHPAAAPRPQEFNRPAPAARPQEFNHPAQAPRPQEFNRPQQQAPRQEFNRPAPAPRPQEFNRPQQHEAPRPAPAEHHAEPSRKDKDHDKH